MQVSSLCSPETKSRALRPARSMVRAAISTDRSRTAPTMAASSSGGCKEEAPGAEGPQPAVPPRPTAPGQGSAGTGPRLSCFVPGGFAGHPARPVGPSQAGAQLLCPPPSPGLAPDPGVTTTCRTTLSLIFRPHLPLSPRKGG